MEPQEMRAPARGGSGYGSGAAEFKVFVRKHLCRDRGMLREAGRLLGMGVALH